MRWHTERVKPDDGDEPKLRHLADASQWIALNAEFEFFSQMSYDKRKVMDGPLLPQGTGPVLYGRIGVRTCRI